MSEKIIDNLKKFVPDTEELASYNKELEKTAQIMKSMTEADLDEAHYVSNAQAQRTKIIMDVTKNIKHE